MNSRFMVLLKKARLPANYPCWETVDVKFIEMQEMKEIRLLSRIGVVYSSAHLI